MKRILMALTGVLIAGVLSAQTPAKTNAGAAGLGKATSESDRDLNIRAYIELLRADVQKEKAQVMGEVMQLDAAQAAKFWPMYKSFETDLAAIGDKIGGLIKDYAANYESMTPTVADNLGDRLLSLEQERNALKRKYWGQMKSALDPVTATRFLQVENQLERLVDLQIASSLPVVK
jgi:hypothetical protein